MNRVPNGSRVKCGLFNIEGVYVQDTTACPMVHDWGEHWRSRPAGFVIPPAHRIEVRTKLLACTTYDDMVRVVHLLENQRKVKAAFEATLVVQRGKHRRGKRHKMRLTPLYDAGEEVRHEATS